MGIDYEKFKRHCNMGVDVELENEKGEKDVFKLKPLNIKQIALFQFLASKFNEGTLDLQDTEEMITLFKEVIKNSYPDLDDEIAENFAVNNLTDFMLVMDKLSPRQDERKVRQLQRMQELQKAKLKQNESVDNGNTENTQ